MNRFQPTPEEVLLLKDSEIVFSTLSASDWVRFCEEESDFTETYLDSMGQNIIDDQLARAQAYAELFWMKNYSTIVLMDGHGRMLYTILKCLQHWDINIDQLDIYVVDLDPIVHEWHQLFFPNNVISLQDDIIDLLEQHLDLQDEDENPTVLPYLNFCGLHGQQERVWNLVQRWTHGMYLSFTLEGQAFRKGGSKWSKRHLYRNPSKVMGLVGQIYQLEKSHTACEVSRRMWSDSAKKTTPFFITYEIATY